MQDSLWEAQPRRRGVKRLSLLTALPSILLKPPHRSRAQGPELSQPQGREPARAMAGEQVAFGWPHSFRTLITGRTIRCVAQTMALGATDTWTGYINLDEP